MRQWRFKVFGRPIVIEYVNDENGDSGPVAYVPVAPQPPAAPAASATSQANPFSSSLLLIGVVILVGIGTGVWSLWSNNRPCVEREPALSRELIALRQEWNDALEITRSTPRISLGPAIADMQAIRRRVQAIQAPACAVAAKTALIEYMDATIAASTGFLAQEPDPTVEVKANIAATAATVSQTEIALLQEPPR